MINPIKKITWGMYPTKLPGTSCPLAPGLLPRTIIFPESTCNLPTMHLSNVVFPHPLGPRSPYLKYTNKSLWIYLMFRWLQKHFKRKHLILLIFVYCIQGYFHSMFFFSLFYTWKQFRPISNSPRHSCGIRTISLEHSKYKICFELAQSKICPLKTMANGTKIKWG